MIEKILVPLDGSPLAACVFAHVVTLAEATHAHVTLISVLEKDHENATRINPLDWQLRRVEVERYLDDVAMHLSEFLDSKPETKVLEGSAAERIVDYAHKQQVDLIVLSSHGKGGLNGWNVSSVAQKVIQRAGKSVLLVPAYRLNSETARNDFAGLAYRRILAPLDGSQRAETVLPVVTALAQQSEAELYLVHVIARPEMMQRIPLSNEESALAEQLVERNRAQATHYLEQLQARLTPNTHVNVILNGHVAASLHKVIEHDAIDLVVVSAHGYSGDERWPYGSMVTNFITYASVPLLILQDMPQQAIQSSEAERLVVLPQTFWRKEEDLSSNALSSNALSSNALSSNALVGNSGLWQAKLGTVTMREKLRLVVNRDKLGDSKTQRLNDRAEPAKLW